MEYNEKRLQESLPYWDDLASTFDNEPDHGLCDSLIRETWTKLLKTWLPQTNLSILDIGCGTGSLSVVLAGLGHKVIGLEVKDFELLVSLNVFNSALMNDAVFKFKRYEDSSLVYTGINRHEGEDIGLFDTVLKRGDYSANEPIEIYEIR